MKKIVKYTIEDGDLIIAAKDPKWLDAQMQDGLIRVWAIVDLAAEDKEEYYLYTLGTGWPCKRIPGEYIGTVQDGCYVWHVFAAQIHRPMECDMAWQNPEMTSEGFYVS